MSDEKAIEWVAINIRDACEAAGLRVWNRNDMDHAMTKIQGERDAAIARAEKAEAERDDAKALMAAFSVKLSEVIAAERVVIGERDEWKRKATALNAGAANGLVQQLDTQHARIAELERELTQAREIARKWHGRVYGTPCTGLESDGRIIASWPEVNP